MEPLSPQEFLSLVEKQESAGAMGRSELLNGRIVRSPPEGWPHGAVGSAIQMLLGGWAQTHPLGIVMDSSQGFLLPSGDIVQPDHPFLSLERVSAANPRDGELVAGVPNLVVEVISPATAIRDSGEKQELYERTGVDEYWLVDPATRTLTTFALRDGRYGPSTPLGEGERYRSPMLGLDLEVKTLFPQLSR